MECFPFKYYISNVGRGRRLTIWVNPPLFDTAILVIIWINQCSIFVSLDCLLIWCFSFWKTVSLHLKKLFCNLWTCSSDHYAGWLDMIWKRMQIFLLDIINSPLIVCLALHPRHHVRLYQSILLESSIGNYNYCKNWVNIVHSLYLIILCKFD